MSIQTRRILIADDDKFIRDDLADLLRDPANAFTFASTAAETWQRIIEDNFHLVMLDIKFPDCKDLSLLKRIKALPFCPEVIVISSEIDNVAQVVEAIKSGSYDYVGKPFIREELRNRVEKALSLQSLRRSQEHFLDELEKRDGVDSFMGTSTAIRLVRDMIRKVADLDCCVLIGGESGTGKELIARALHFQSKRRTEPFVVVNCAAIPEQLIDSVLFGHKKGAFTGAFESARGRFEAAGEGTIFLDEIGDMPLLQQASLLRVLEYRKFTPVGENAERRCDARFVLATNRDLKESVRDGKFREDLYYRINVANIVSPPLRARPDDIPVIVEYLCARLTGEMGRAPIGVDADVMARLQQYDWPGNVRELRNVLESAIMLGDPRADSIRVTDLPQDILSARGPTEEALSSQELSEKREIIKALKLCHGNQTAAAKILNYHRNTIRVKMRYYGIASFE